MKNKNQCMDFKVKEEEQWSTFAGARLADQKKLNGTFMCGRWHTQGHCFWAAITRPVTSHAQKSAWM